MPTMPHWAQWIVLASVLAIAVAAIWTKVLRPLSKLIVFLDQILPLLTALLAQSQKDPDYLAVLYEIAAQFKTDSGSTLRDIINELLASAKEAKKAAEDLRVEAGVIKEKVAIVKELASDDRAESVKDRIERSKKLVLLDDVLLRLKHLEGLLSVAQTSQQPIMPQQLIPPASGLMPPVSGLPASIASANVIAVVEAHKPGTE